MLKVFFHFLVAYCWEDFLTVCTIFVHVFEKFRLLAASYFMETPKNCVSTYKCNPMAFTIESVLYTETENLRIKMY